MSATTERRTARGAIVASLRGWLLWVRFTGCIGEIGHLDEPGREDAMKSRYVLPVVALSADHSVELRRRRGRPGSGDRRGHAGHGRGRGRRPAAFGRRLEPLAPRHGGAGGLAQQEGLPDHERRAQRRRRTEGHLYGREEGEKHRPGTQRRPRGHLQQGERRFVRRPGACRRRLRSFRHRQRLRQR